MGELERMSVGSHNDPILQQRGKLTLPASPSDPGFTPPPNRETGQVNTESVNSRPRQLVFNLLTLDWFLGYNEAKNTFRGCTNKSKTKAWNRLT